MSPRAIALAALPLTLLLAQPIFAQQRHLDRGEFAARMSKIEYGDSSQKARRLLGAPDAIVEIPETPGVPPRVTWKYGVEPPSGFATLGEITFEHDKADTIHGGHGTPPSTRVISEPDLRRAMTYTFEEASFHSTGDLLNRIRATNYLHRLGTDKARAVMTEISRVSGGSTEDTWLYWLAFTLFDVPAAPGYMPTPRIGGISPAPPKEGQEAPRFPVVVMEDVPFCVYGGVSLSGGPESFFDYMARFPAKALVRNSPLHPPDDPFLAIAELTHSAEWSAIYVGAHRYGEGDYHLLLKQVLQLVRTAYPTPEGAMQFSFVPWKDFEKHHQAYLKLGCRWDEKEQCYVRKDGSHDPIRPLSRER